MIKKPIICFITDNLSMEMVELELGDEVQEFGQQNDEEVPDLEEPTFGDDTQLNPESVDGDGKDNKGTSSSGQETKPPGSSPKPNVYFETFKGLHEDGLFPDIDEEFAKTINTPELFQEAFNKQLEAKLTSEQRRLKDALDNGINLDEYSQIEDKIQYFDSITVEQLESETLEAEELRKNLIYNDLLSKGFKEERAKKVVAKAVEDATDIEDAKEAFNSLKEQVTTQYNHLLESRRNERITQENKQKEFTTNLQKISLDTEKPFEGLEVTKEIRQKVWDNISKPIHSIEGGTKVTELQKFALEQPEKASYYLSLFYTLTDGFTKLDKLTKKVSNEVKNKGVKSLEKLLEQGESIGSSDYTPAIDEETYSFGGELDV